MKKVFFLYPENTFVANGTIEEQNTIAVKGEAPVLQPGVLNKIIYPSIDTGDPVIAEISQVVTTYNAEGTSNTYYIIK